MWSVLVCTEHLPSDPESFRSTAHHESGRRDRAATGPPRSEQPCPHQAGTAEHAPPTPAAIPEHTPESRRTPTSSARTNPSVPVGPETQPRSRDTRSTPRTKSPATPPQAHQASTTTDRVPIHGHRATCSPMTEQPHAATPARASTTPAAPHHSRFPAAPSLPPCRRTHHASCRPPDPSRRDRRQRDAISRQLPAPATSKASPLNHIGVLSNQTGLMTRRINKP